MYKISVIFLLLLLSCTKKDSCGIHTFKAVSCEENAKGPIWEVSELNPPTIWILSPEECEFHRQNFIKMCSGTYFLNGKQISPEDLIWCECM